MSSAFIKPNLDNIFILILDGDWKVWVKTGKVATKASVVLVVYGDDGVSQPFTLGKGGKELFKAGEENEFKVSSFVCLFVCFLCFLVIFFVLNFYMILSLKGKVHVW